MQVSADPAPIYPPPDQLVRATGGIGRCRRRCGRRRARRTAAGAQAVDRSRDADPAALVAAELAVWALGDPDTDSEPGVWF